MSLPFFTSLCPERKERKGHRHEQRQGKARAKQSKGKAKQGQSKARAKQSKGKAKHLRTIARGEAYGTRSSRTSGSAPDQCKLRLSLMCTVAYEQGCTSMTHHPFGTAQATLTLVHGRCAICARGTGAIRLLDYQGDKMPVHGREKGKGGNVTGGL